MEIWELTDAEKSKLSEEDKMKYDTAVEYIGHDWACGSWGGWARGYDILKEMGWKEMKVVTGHREFLSLVKPNSDTKAI